MDGSFWAFGLNNYGQLGLGDITDRSSPVQVGALTTFSGYQNRRHSLGIWAEYLRPIRARGYNRSF